MIHTWLKSCQEKQDHTFGWNKHPHTMFYFINEPQTVCSTKAYRLIRLLMRESSWFLFHLPVCFRRCWLGLSHWQENEGKTLDGHFYFGFLLDLKSPINATTKKRRSYTTVCRLKNVRSGSELNDSGAGLVLNSFHTGRSYCALPDRALSFFLKALYDPSYSYSTILS